MKAFEGRYPLRPLVVLSLCDYSGNWPRPWHEAGHTVLCYDLKHGDDLTQLTTESIGWDIWNTVRPAGAGSSIRVAAVLSAPLCTAFTNAAALHRAAHELDGTTQKCVALAEACCRIRDHFKPDVSALENPRGRIAKLVPAVGPKQFEFHPYQYAGYLDASLLEVTHEDDVHKVMASNRYEKQTAIYGQCIKPEEKSVPPLVYRTATGKKGGVIWAKLGGKSERTKEIRSTTPMGFAKAFYLANAT